MLKKVKEFKNFLKLKIESFFNSEKFKKNKILMKFIFKRKIYSKRNVSVFERLCLTISVVFTAFIITSSFTQNNAQAVYINDKQVGIIDDANISENELSSDMETKLSKGSGKQTSLNEKISLVPVIASSSDTISKEELLNGIKSDISYDIDAYSISVNGQIKAYLSSQKEAETLLNNLKTSKIKKSNKLISSDFVDDVKIEKKFVKADTVSSFEDAKKVLTKNKVNKKVYTVVEGDTIEKIAKKVNLKLSELYKLNPSITENSILNIGDEVIITEEKPFLSVETVFEVTSKKEIPFETEKIENDEEYKNYKKVIAKGVNGEKEVVEAVSYVDGKEVSRTTIKETVLSEPKTQKVEVGTLQEPPKKATGTFIYPVNGVFTSGFGPRWGTVHKGIDLAAPAGTPVYASDGGIVTFAGWNSGGFGNLVKISHENGFVTYYAHNTSVAVSSGDRVHQGQLIAYVGTTGDSTGNHCHFEIRKNGVPNDPMKYLN